MKLKRIISLWLIFSVVLSIKISPVTAESKPTDLYLNEIEFLKSVEVLPENFMSDDITTKAQLTEMIINALNHNYEYSLPYNNESIFNDVPANHKYYSSIKACRDLGIVNGDTENNFYPDKPVNTVTVLTMLINALGCKVYADSEGGYPTGYLTVARTSGILNGVEIPGTDALKGALVAKLIYNSLFAGMASIKSIDKDNINLDMNGGKNLLSQRLGINEYDAIIIDDGISSISGESINDINKIAIKDNDSGNRIVAYVGNTDISSHLGNRVKVFVKYNNETGNNEVIHYSFHRNSDTVILNADKIINVTNGYIEYEKDKTSGKFNKLNFGSEPPIVILNGIHKTDYTPSDFKPDDGIVTLVDNDADSIYDLVKILNFNYYSDGTYKEARNIVVDEINLENKYISCRFNPVNTIDLNEYDYIYRIFSDGDIKTLEDIKEYDIVSVAEAPQKVNGKTLLNLYVTRKTINSSISYVNEKEIYLPSDEEYKISSSVLMVKPKFTSTLVMSSETTFCLDATGKIAYAIAPELKSVNYAYLVNAGIKREADSYVLIKLFTKDAEMKLLKLSSKVIIDGNTYDTPESQYNAIIARSPLADKLSVEDTSISRPVIYKCNNEEYVTYIDTDTPNDTNYSAEDNLYANQTSLRYTNEEADNKDTLKAGFRSPMFYQLRAASKTIEGKFYITGDTTIINVPDIDTYAIEDISKLRTLTYHYYSEQAQNENWIIPNVTFDYKMIKLHEQDRIDENYKILLSSHLDSKYMYDIQGYNIDTDTGIADLVILRGRTDWYGSMLNANEPIYYFLRRTSAYDQARQRVVTKIYFTPDGVNEQYVLCEEDNISFTAKYLIYGCDSSFTSFGKAVAPLKEGDMIRIKQKGDWLEHIERVIRMDNLKNTLTVMRFPDNSTIPYSTSFGGIGSTVYQEFSMPFDTNYYQDETVSAPLMLTYVKSAKGNVIKTYVGSANGKRLLKDIDVNNPATYVEQYFNISGVNILVADFTGGKFRLKKGSVSDIITLDKANGINGASKVLIKHSAYTPNYILVINGK